MQTEPSVNDQSPTSEQPAPPRGAGLAETVTFLAGAAVLGAQIAVGALVSATLGADTTAWAATIAVVLLSLSLGYSLGGRLADRKPSSTAFSAVALLAGASLAASPFAIRAMLELAADRGPSAGPAFGAILLGGFGLLALPVALLGGLLPYAVRLRLGSGGGGAVVGRLYAISSAGNLAGIMLALALMPLLGPLAVCLVLGLAVMSAGVGGLLAARPPRGADPAGDPAAHCGDAGGRRQRAALAAFAPLPAPARRRRERSPLRPRGGTRLERDESAARRPTPSGHARDKPSCSQMIEEAR